MTTLDIVAVCNDLSPIPALPRSQWREQQGGLFHEGYDSNGGSTD